jgi:dolichol-phosphate mannosyltransferase
MLESSTSSGGRPSFAVVIPMFNEQEGADRAVRQVVTALERGKTHSALIVVDDGSSDRTAAVLSQLAQELPRLVVAHHDGNRGYGAALQTGTRAAADRGFAYVLFMDSDLTNSPEDIPRFVTHMDEGTDVIKATRYSGGGGTSGVPFVRWIVSAAGNQLARVLLRVPVHDCTNGFRAVRVQLLQCMRLHETRFAVIMEELYWCRYLARTYAEVPVILTNRDDQRGTSFAYRPRVFWSYLKYPLKAFIGIRPKGFAAGSTRE